jgi:lipopolysaccharide heptosyltransferase II
MRSAPWRPKPVLERRYPGSSLPFALIFFFIDTALAIVVYPFRRWTPPERVHRILLVNGAHLGDLVITTSVIPLLKKAYPEAQIGVWIGSWGRPVMENHPEVSFIHIVDHYRLNRQPHPRLKKILRYCLTAWRSITEIRQRDYDVAINLYEKPNVIPLLLLTRIPVRVGYDHGGFGPLLTHPMRWKDGHKHLAHHYVRLLSILQPAAQVVDQTVSYNLPLSTEAIEEFPEWDRIRRQKFIVLHPGTGQAARRWPEENWANLQRLLSNSGMTVVLSGAGADDVQLCERLATNAPAINVAGKLSWPQFLRLVAASSCIVCVESVASHVAAAYKRPCVAIWSGVNDPGVFEPLSANAICLTAPVPCSPCHKPCAGMECVRQVTVQQVFERIAEVFGLDKARL